MTSKFESSTARKSRLRSERQAAFDQQRGKEDHEREAKRAEMAEALQINIECKGLARAVVDFIEDRRSYPRSDSPGKTG